MAIWLVAAAAAEGLSNMAAGGLLVASDAPEVSGGFELGALNEDTRIFMAFGPKDAAGRTIRAWRIEAGAWGPLLSTPEAKVPTPTQVADATDDDGAAPDLAPAPEKPKVVQSIFHMALGGDTWEDERFLADFDGHALLDLPALAGLAPSTFYAGPALGAGFDVVYPEGGGPAAGEVTLGGGVYAGVFVAEAFFARVRALAELDPFVPGMARLTGGAVLGGSLREAGAPVALTVGGDATRGIGEGAELRWQGHAAIQYVFPE